MDKIIIIVCGILALMLSTLLVWWLKVGKQRFIEKRCPERLTHTENFDNIPAISLSECFHNNNIDMDSVNKLVCMTITSMDGRASLIMNYERTLLQIAICRTFESEKGNTFEAVIDTLHEDADNARDEWKLDMFAEIERDLMVYKARLENERKENEHRK